MRPDGIDVDLIPDLLFYIGFGVALAVFCFAVVWVLANLFIITYGKIFSKTKFYIEGDK